MKKLIFIFTIITSILIIGTAPTGITGNVVWEDSLKGLNSDVIRVDSLGKFNWTVSDTTELYKALDNLSDGDVIYITQGIYRTNRWLEINKNGVSIIGQGYNNADTVGVWIKPVDNGNVGGFKIGNTTNVEDIRIEGIRFHGNAANQSNSMKRCHAFWFYDAHNSIIRNCYITNTHPQNEHHTGGSGITVNHAATHIDILNNTIYDSGDRDIQVAGKYIRIVKNYGSNGYNRFISFDVKEEDGNFYSAGFVICTDNVGRDRSNGSIIGFSPRSISNPSDTLGHFSISNNIGLGYYRAFIKMGVDFPEDITCSISITNNIGYGISSYHEGILVGKYITATNRNLKVEIRNNKLHNFKKAAIRFANRDNCIIVGNQIYGGNAEGIELENAGNVTIRNNVIENATTCGIEVTASDSGNYTQIQISGNNITNCGGNGLESIDVSYGGDIFIDSSYSPTISDSIIAENKATYGGVGIYCNRISPTIAENTISNNIGNGIYCQASSPTIISNIITDNAGCGIYSNLYSPTITYNNITGNTDGGVYCIYSSPIITNNTISNNVGGGIICLEDCSPIITGNTITGNIANFGGGIHCEYNSSPTIMDNTITDNTADFLGSGIYCYSGSSPTIINNTISWNKAKNGGAIHCYYSSPTIDSCTISNNDCDGIYSQDSSSPVINYNNIIDNTGYGIRNVDPCVTINALYNWWGDHSGPGGDGPGNGDEVSKWVDYDPWLTDSVSGIEEKGPNEKIFFVSQGKPNPFKNKTVVAYSLPKTCNVNISIYNTLGARVRTLLNERRNTGMHTITWDGRNDSGNKLPSGFYFLRLEADDYKETRKLLLIR